MEVFKYKLWVHLMNVAGIIVVILLLAIPRKIGKNNMIGDFASIVLILLTTFHFVNFSYTTFFINSDGITHKSLIKKQRIMWSEIQYIVEQPRGRLEDKAIEIFAGNKSILIYSEIKDCEILLLKVIEEYQKIDNAKIDSNILAKIKDIPRTK